MEPVSVAGENPGIHLKVDLYSCSQLFKNCSFVLISLLLVLLLLLIVVVVVLALLLVLSLFKKAKAALSWC